MKAVTFLWVMWLFWFVQTNFFFGWNLHPRSPEELIADGIGWILLAITVVATRWSKWG